MTISRPSGFLSSTLFLYHRRSSIFFLKVPLCVTNSDRGPLRDAILQKHLLRGRLFLVRLPNGLEYPYRTYVCCNTRFAVGGISRLPPVRFTSTRKRALPFKCFLLVRVFAVIIYVVGEEALFYHLFPLREVGENFQPHWVAPRYPCSAQD